MTQYKVKAVQPEARVLAAMLARQFMMSDYRDQNVSNHTRNP